MVLIFKINTQKERSKEMRLKKLIFHGAGMEIGRSCIEVVLADNTRFLLDAGQKNVGRGEFSVDVFLTSVKKPEKIKAVFLTHAHIDHCGSLPYLVSRGLNCPIYCSPATKSIAAIMFRDAVKLAQKAGVLITLDDVKKTLRLMRTDEPSGNISGVKFGLYPVGHIPGAMGVHLVIGRQSFFYAGDFSGKDSRLTKGCDFKSLPQIDVLITESTYGVSRHQPRKRIEERIKSLVVKTIQKGGTVIIPSFAVAKSQELILVLHDLFEQKIYFRSCIDGMGKSVTEAMLDHPESLNNPKLLSEAYGWTAKLNDWSRKSIGQNENPSSIIATSGMINGGPVLDYIRLKGGDRKNLILIPGFQAIGTPGRELLETGMMTFENGEVIRPKCRVRQIHLATHADRSDQKKLIRATKPKMVIVQHGDPKSCEAVACLAEEMGCETKSPRTGEIIKFK
jgi:Cft2 family RNA processing exonuclease